MGGGDRQGKAVALLREVADPELPVLSILDLGMVRDICLDDRMKIVLTPTYLGCAAFPEILRRVRTALEEGGLGDAIVEVRHDPPWTSDWITPEGREKLLQGGLAAPAPRRQEPRCPRCDAAETEELSSFGAAACLSLRRCCRCREPFHAFRCH